jgi:hypothetical protein
MSEKQKQSYFVAKMVYFSSFVSGGLELPFLNSLDLTMKKTALFTK